ncbi:molecular chaperone HtpG [Alsobacter sp. R-9]
MDTDTLSTSPGAAESRPFEADVSRLLHLMVHSVYSDRDIFLRELIANAADACEKLRTLALQQADLLGDDTRLHVVIRLDKEARTLTVADNGIGMSRDEMLEALGTIARSGTKAFIEALGEQGDGSRLIGQFGVGFYSAFMVAGRVDVVSRRAGTAEAWCWSSDGHGTYTIEPRDLDDAPARGTRVILHLSEDAADYAEPWTVERIVKAHGSAIPVPVELVEAEGAEPRSVTDGTALWTKPKSSITADEYKAFYQSLGGQFDDPAMTLHWRAEGRHEYSVLAFVPSQPPFALFDPMRKGRMKLYVRRMFIADDIEILPGYLRFVSGIVDSADLPLNLSRETIQESAILGAIRKGVTNRVLSDLEKLAENDAEAYGKVWNAFGAVLKEGLYEDMERRDQLYKLARFTTSTHPDGDRSLKAYVEALRPNQTAIWYLVGDDKARLAASPHLEGFRARGIEVLLLSDPVDAFWVNAAIGFEGKPFKSVTQGAADIDLVPLLDETATPPAADVDAKVATLLAFFKETLEDHVETVRASNRLADSASCLVAAEHGPDRGLEKLLAASGRATGGQKPVLEINTRLTLVQSLAEKFATGGDRDAIGDAAHLLLDQARAAEGLPPVDPAASAKRLNALLAKALG